MNGKLNVSERIRVKCPQCHSRICDRVQVEKDWALHYQSGSKISIISEPGNDTYWVVTCRKCQTTLRVSPTKGVIETYRAEHYDRRIQAETGTS